MAIIDINLNPSTRDLRWFGCVMLLFFALIGALVLWRTESILAAAILGSIGVTFCAVYYSFRPFRRPMYIGWMRLVYPIGWTVSHIVLGTVYYVFLTPLGWLRRTFWHDDMQRKIRREVDSYWEEHDPTTEIVRYFRQF